MRVQGRLAAVAKVAGVRAVLKCSEQCILNRGGLLLKTNMAKHHQSGEHQCSWVGNSLASNVRRGAVDCFKDGDIATDVCTRSEAEPAHKTSGKITDNVALQVGEHHHLVLRWLHHQVHAQSINDHVGRGDAWVFQGHGAESFQEQTISHLHDVGLVRTVHRVNPHALGSLKCEAEHFITARRGDDALGDHHIVGEAVLNAAVGVLDILTHDGKVKIDASLAVRRDHARQCAKVPIVGVCAPHLARRNVDGLTATAGRRSHGSLEENAKILDDANGLISHAARVAACKDRFAHFNRNEFHQLADSRRSKEFQGGSHDFWSDSVASSKRNTHESIPSREGGWPRGRGS